MNRRYDHLRIAFICPFFGSDARSDDERRSFQWVNEAVSAGLNVTVFTTCGASSCDEWSLNTYRSGRDLSEAFVIERFPLVGRDRPRYEDAYNRLRAARSFIDDDAERMFMQHGVRSPDLLAHVQQCAEAFDAFVFTPYGASTTLNGIALVGERAIVLPQLDNDPSREFRIVRASLGGARAFACSSSDERDALVALIGAAVARRVRVVGPLHDESSWSPAINRLGQLVEELPGLEDGRSREIALAQVAYLYPIVRRQRAAILAMQQSRFWKLRETWFAIKSRFGIGVDPLPYLTSEREAAELGSVMDPYVIVRERQALRESDVDRIQRVIAALPKRPRIAWLVDARGATVAALGRTTASLRDQLYDECAALVLTDPGDTRNFVTALAAVNARFVPVTEPTLGDADYIGPLRCGDTLERDAALEFALAALASPAPAAIYADHDERDTTGSYRSPHFKPDWSPDSILSGDYVGPTVVCRRTHLAEMDLRVDVPVWWYEALLRIAERNESIAHVARVLYHLNESRDPREERAVAQAINAALERRNEPGSVERMPLAGPSHFGVRYVLKGEPKVAIVVPTRDRADLLADALSSVFRRSSYKHYEVIVVDNGSVEERTMRCFDAFLAAEPTRFRVLRVEEPFNYSRLNNLAAASTDAPLLLLLNNDTRVISQDWIETLAGYALRRGVGAAGAMLLYEDNVVQHGGVILGVLGLAGHAHRFLPADAPGYRGTLQVPTNYLALTGACLMVAHDKYDEVGGLDESLAVSYNDVDFCLRLHERGYRNVYIPQVRLYHFESKSRGLDNTLSKVRRAAREVAVMRARYPVYAARDPFYNPNLTSDAEDFSLRL